MTFPDNNRAIHRFSCINSYHLIANGNSIGNLHKVIIYTKMIRIERKTLSLQKTKDNEKSMYSNFLRHAKHGSKRANI